MTDESADRSSHAAARAPAEPQRLLLVEDSDGDAELISGALVEAWPQVQLQRSRSPSNSLPMLATGAECVLIDLAVQATGANGNGLDAVRHIRDAESELPIVAIVESDSQGELALSAGAQDFVLKDGVDGVGMARVIRHAIQRGRAERFWRELAVLRSQNAESARVQRGLIPRLLIADERIATRSGYRPGDRRQVLGGDFFDVIQTSPTRLQIVLGDVSGHGPDEAALGVQLRIAWRTLVLAGVDHAQLIVTLDRLAAQERHADHI